MQWAPSDSLSFYWDNLYSEGQPCLRAQRPESRGAQHQHQRSGERGAGRRPRGHPARPSRIRSGSTKTARTRKTRTSSIQSSAWNGRSATSSASTRRSTTTTATGSVRPTPTCSTRSLNTGITVDIEANGDGVIKVTPSRDLNDLNFWTWNALRIQPVQREVWQKGGRIERRVRICRSLQAVGAASARTSSTAKSPTGTTTSCATDGGNTTSAAGRAMLAALAAAGIQNAKVAIPNAQLGQYMQTWTHGALYNTSDFNVGLNNGWALPNYRMLDPATQHRLLRERPGRRAWPVANDVAGYNPRVIDEDTDRRLPRGQRQVRRAGRLALQRGRASHRDRPDRLGLRHREHADGRGAPAADQQRRLRQEPAGDQHRAATWAMAWWRARRTRQTMTRPAAWRHRAERGAERDRRRADARQPGARAVLLRQLRPGSRVVLR